MYNAINLKNKYVVNTVSNQLRVKETDTGGRKNTGGKFNQFQDRILGIDEEMKKIDSTLGEFLNVVSTDFTGIIGKIDNMKKNMSLLKGERS